MKVRISIAGAALLGALAATAPAQATERSMLVSYADLDLTTAEGTAALERRLQRASRQVCRDTRVRSVRDSMDEMRCKREARQQSEITMASIMRDVRLGG